MAKKITRKCNFDIPEFNQELKNRVLEIIVKDYQGIDADRANVVIDDKHYRIPLPELDTKFSVYLGYNDKIKRCGTYYISEVIYREDPERTIEIIGMPFKTIPTNLTTPETHEFKEKTMGKIFSEIAKKFNHTLQCDPNFCNIYMDHVTQRRESASNFLTRLADQYDFYVKITDGKINVFPKNIPTGFISFSKSKDDQISISGAVVTVISRFSWRKSTRMQYSGVRTKFKHPGKKGDQEVLIGSAKKVYEDDAVYISKAEAERIGKAKLDTLLRSTGVLESFELPGDPNVIAGLTGFFEYGFKPEMDPYFQVKEVTHTMNASGYRITGRGDKPYK